MIGIAFDLGWPTFVTFDNHAARKAAKCRRGREIERLAGNQFFRLTNIRHDLFSSWLDAATSTHACQRN